MSVGIRSMTEQDGTQVMEIYQQGLDTGMASFQRQAPPFAEWDRAHRPECRLVAESGGRIAGWAALSSTSARYVYRGVVEVSIYVAKDFRGMGVGALLLDSLIEDSEAQGIWTLQSVIFCDNEASLRLHQKHGFRIVGRRERVGFDELRGEWRDTYLLERRSTAVGL